MKTKLGLLGLPLILNAAVIAAMPIPAFGTKKADPEPAPKPEENKPEYKDTGVPLHGSTDQSTGTAGASGDKLDQSALAKDALKVSGKVTDAGPNETGDLHALLERAKAVTDKTTLARRDVVALRIQLQRFRQQDEKTAQIVDDETRRLEAIILGLQVEPGDTK